MLLSDTRLLSRSVLSPSPVTATGSAQTIEPLTHTHWLRLYRKTCQQTEKQSKERQGQPPPNYIMPWNPLSGPVLSSKLGRSLSLSPCPEAKLGQWVSWIPFNPYKRQTYYHGEIAALRAADNCCQPHPAWAAMSKTIRAGCCLLCVLPSHWQPQKRL